MAEDTDSRRGLGGPLPAGQPEVQRLDELAPTSVADEWRSFARRLPDSTYFQSPDWVLSWWATVGGRPPTECATWRDSSGALEALLVLSRRPERLHPRLPVAVPTWVIAGSGPGAADHVGLLAVDHRRGDVWRWLAQRTRGAPVLLRNLDPTSTGGCLPSGARLVERSACPRLDIPPDQEMTGGSAKLRKQLRAYDRRLAREGVQFRWVEPSAMTGSMVDLLFKLHGLRYQLKDEPSGLLPGQWALHDRLVASAREAGDDNGPAAILAEHGGEPVGMLYGFMWNGVFSYYQTGWDPAWSSRSLGTVLVGQAISLAGRQGAQIFDFLRGVDAYKYRFGGVDRFDETWIMPNGGLGRLLDLKYRAKQHLASRTPQDSAR